jgi:transposase
MLAVVVAHPGQEREWDWERRKFGTSVQELGDLRAWLAQQRVGVAVMESTAQYWKPVWIALEGHFELQLAQARSNKAPRGRKSDFADARRLVKRWRAEDLTLSYVPEAEQRRWRSLTHFQVKAICQRGRLQNQIEALLEEGQIKLSCVVSDLLGTSARRILRALAEGETEVQKLVALRDPRMAASEAEWVAALQGQLHPLHRRLLGMYLEQVELIDQHLEMVGKELGEALKAHQEAVERLCEMPGLGVDSAQQVIAQIGPRAEAFASPEQLASWVGVCPGRQESAGVSASQRSPKGNRPMRRLLVQLAWAAVRTKGSQMQLLFQRWVPRLGVNAAIWAVAHRLLRLVWKVLHQEVRYQERGPLGLNAITIQRRKRRLVRQLRELGYTVKLEAVKPPQPAAATA